MTNSLLLSQAEAAGLAPLAAKVLAGERLDLAEGLQLSETPHLGLVLALANVVRERLHGDVSWFNRNLHVNATNVCEASCVFCSFARLKTGDPESWTMSMEEATGRVRALDHALVTEVHVVNGLNPDLPYGYYPTLIRELKAARPDIHVKGFTAVEIHYYAEKYGMSYEEVLTSMMEAGLGSMPGGGAEIFHPRARVKLCHDKVDAEGWLEVHRTAHRLGMFTNCTMLFGSIETLEERVDHLIRLRELQDESLAGPARAAAGEGPAHKGGQFNTFIPLRFHNDNNRLSALASPTGAESLRTIALSRLMLDNIPHIKAYWPMLGEDVAQLAQHGGSSDIDGTVHEEHIYHMAGADTPQGLTRGNLVGMVQDAWRVPAERDTLYHTVRRDDAPLPGTGKGARIGVVGYRNAIPLTRHLDGVERRDGHPFEVDRWLRAGEVDLALVPVAALLNGDDWRVVPELCIGCDGPVHSVLFVAERPPEEWTRVLLDGRSRTSITLARLLLTEGPLKDRVPADLEILAAEPGTGVDQARGTVASVVIGDVARELPDRLRERLDLGQLWKEWTGLPFVFAVWAGRADLDPAVVDHVRAAGLQGIADLEDEAFLSTLDPADRAYLTGSIRYPLDDSAMMGLRRFAALACRAGLVERDTLSLYPPRPYRPHSRSAGAPAVEDTALSELLAAAAAGVALSWDGDQRALLEQATLSELMAAASLRRQVQADEPVPFELAWPMAHPPEAGELLQARSWMAELGTKDVVLTEGGWDGLDPAGLAALGAALGGGVGFLDLRVGRLAFAPGQALEDTLAAWKEAGLARLRLDHLHLLADPATAAATARLLATAKALDLPVLARHELGGTELIGELMALRDLGPGLRWTLGTGKSTAAGNRSPAAALRATALAALLLDEVPVLAGDVSLVTAQLALHAGASDLGTVQLVAAPVKGKTLTWSPDAAEAERAIRAAGRTPARRTGDFDILQAARTQATKAGKPVRRAPSLAK